MRSKPAPPALPAMAQMGEIVRPLLAWYRSRARVLPWRQQPTPYRVWISEIMLQQTRVEAVKPYFDRFLAALPTVQSLADTPEDVLLKLWEGLGYYNRARNLQKAAQRVVADFGGALPADYDALLTLPGIGPYTAGAIASIAYGIAMPAVDGNVLRVVSRILASPHDIAEPSVKEAVFARLQEILPPDAPGDFNQALMELGATVCLPKSAARCADCPVASLCLAKAQDAVAALPVKAPKKARRVEEKTVFLLLAGGRAALRKRPKRGLLAGLWELPHAEGRLSTAQARAYLAEQFGFTAQELSPLPDAKHIFTHVEWHMSGYAAHAASPPAGQALHWVGVRELADDFAVPSAFKPFTAHLRIGAAGCFGISLF